MPTKTPLTTKKFLKKRKPYDLVDENDKLVRLGFREDAKKLGLWRRVVHILVFNARGELLICKRPPWTNSYPGLITSSAGGKVEAGETYRAAARRELREELRIVSPVKELGRFDVQTKKHGKVIHRLFSTHAEKVRPHRSEIIATRFVTISDVSRDARLHPKRYALPFIKALKFYKSKTK